MRFVELLRVALFWLQQVARLPHVVLVLGHGVGTLIPYIHISVLLLDSSGPPPVVPGLVSFGGAGGAFCCDSTGLVVRNVDFISRLLLDDEVLISVIRSGL